jgi:hypothetical protein
MQHHPRGIENLEQTRSGFLRYSFPYIIFPALRWAGPAGACRIDGFAHRGKHDLAGRRIEQLLDLGAVQEPVHRWKLPPAIGHLGDGAGAGWVGDVRVLVVSRRPRPVVGAPGGG